VGKNVVVWDVATGKRSKTVLERQAEAAPWTTATLSADGATLAIGIAESKPQRRLPKGGIQPAGAIRRAVPVERVSSSFEPTFYEGSDVDYCTLAYLNLETAKQSNPNTVVENGNLRCIAFAPTGEKLACLGDDQTIGLWDERGKRLAAVKAGLLADGGLQFTTDGTALLVAVRLAEQAGPTIVRISLYDADTLRERRSFEAPAGLHFGAFSADGALVALVTKGHTVRVMEMATAKAVAELKGHTATIRRVVFSADGKRIATGSNDGTILVWDLGLLGKPGETKS
jgi:WD40 repeat protein